MADRNNAYRDGLPMLFSTAPRRRTDEILVALATTGPMKAVDVVACVGRDVSNTVLYLLALADLGLIVLDNPGPPRPAFAMLNAAHAASRELEGYLIAIAPLWTPVRRPEPATETPEWPPARPFDGARVLGDRDRTAILVFIAVLGQVRRTQIVERLNITQHRCLKLLRMWRLRGFVSIRRVEAVPGTGRAYAYSLDPAFPAFTELRAFLLKLGDVYFPRFRTQFKPANDRYEHERFGN